MLKWKDDAGSNHWAEHPIIKDGCVYVPWCEKARRLVEYDAANGEIINSYIAEAGIACSPIVLEDYIFVYYVNAQKTYRIDKIDRTDWTLVQRKTNGSGADFECLEYNSQEDLLYIVTSKGIEAYNSMLGLQWVFPDPRPTIVETGSPLLVDDILYHRSPNGRFYAIDASKGKELWSVPLNYSPDNTYNNPIYDKEHDMVYIGDTDPGRENGNVYGISLTDQTIEWAYPISGGCITSTLTYHQGVVYVPAMHKRGPGYYLALHSADGTLKWMKTGFHDESGWAATAIDDKYLYRITKTYGSLTPYFIIQRAADGELIKEEKVDYHAVCSNPVIWGGEVYVGSYGAFYCFEIGCGSKDRDVGFHGDYRTGHTADGITSYI